ncbi:hypothetical protein PHLGIDRAFT_73255, partial [Phlebiopsis gigantea 11061_1 CR5-6]
SNTVKVLLAYEYIITFDQELSAIWRRKFNATSLLFITVRWTMLFNAALLSIPPSARVSNTYFSQLFSALRVYAIWDRSWVWTLVIFVLSFAWCAIFYTEQGLLFGLFRAVVFTIHGSIIATDVMVLTLTWIKTFHQWRESRQLGMHVPISTCLLRDGNVSAFSA